MRGRVLADDAADADDLAQQLLAALGRDGEVLCVLLGCQSIAPFERSGCSARPVLLEELRVLAQAHAAVDGERDAADPAGLR